MTSFSKKFFPASIEKPLSASFKIKSALHLNEMPLDIPNDLKKRIAKRVAKLSFNRYPEPFADSLARELAEWYGCEANMVMVGPGSSAFIRLLLTYFALHKNGKIVIARPSFTYYEQYCQAFNIDYKTWELDERFNFDISKLDKLARYSVVFLTSPNNPTGNVLSLNKMKKLLQKHPSSLFVIDEAYAEFLNHSMLSLVTTYDNVVLLRTFSKAFCAAGLRCGVLISNPTLIKALNRIQTPWQLPSITIEAVKEVISYAHEVPWFRAQIKAVTQERDHLYERCRSLKCAQYVIYPSQANFILIKSVTKSAHTILMAACEQAGVLVKDLSNEPRLANYIRVTIGKSEENSLFFSAFQTATKEYT